MKNDCEHRLLYALIRFVSSPSNRTIHAFDIAAKIADRIEGS